MIGIKFLIKNEYDISLNKNFMVQILPTLDGNLKMKKYSVNMENFFFDKTDYINNEFQNMIQKKHYPVHLNLQMYYKNSDVNQINNYDQFLISSCQLIIFIVDNVFVEIYAKNQTILEKI